MEYFLILFLPDSPVACPHVAMAIFPKLKEILKGSNKTDQEKRK